MKEYVERAIAETVQVAEKRSPRIVSNNPFLNDKDWAEAVAIVRTKGPLSAVEEIAFIDRHHRFARAHLVDLVFEIERLYEIIRQMALAKEPT